MPDPKLHTFNILVVGPFHHMLVLGLPDYRKFLSFIQQVDINLELIFVANDYEIHHSGWWDFDLYGDDRFRIVGQAIRGLSSC